MSRKRVDLVGDFSPVSNTVRIDDNRQTHLGKLLAR
jgi:hypothetical protein